MLLENNISNLNSDVIDFSLKGTDGKVYSIQDFSTEEILVIIFMCNHCPYVKAVIKRFTELQHRYAEKSVQLIGINPNDIDAYQEDSFDNMKIFYKENKINFPYLIDDTQETARKYDAVCTPDIYVYNKERKLKYRGRLDDNWKEETNVTKPGLENAIKDILAGKDPDVNQKPSMGCSIKWKT
ncbi:MAG TPA: thioredoxin family protein [Ignavibacteria bacterium]